MKKLLTVIILTAVTITPASAASKNKLPVWQHVDRQGNVYKLCDGSNLVYRMGANGSYGHALFVIPGGCK
jgi:hypothetical protein